jgi:hypothetical protein
MKAFGVRRGKMAGHVWRPREIPLDEKILRRQRASPA